MIRLYLRWCITWISANLRSVSFWLMSAVLAASFVLASDVAGNFAEDTRVLLYYNDTGTGGAWDNNDAPAGTSYAEDSYVRACVDYLLEHEPEGFEFDIVYDKEALIRLVSKGDVSCGVVFGASDDTRDARYKEREAEYIDESITDKGIVVTIYQSAGSADGYVVREIVYPVIARTASVDELKDYVDGIYKGQLTSDEVVSYVADRYMEYLDSLDLKLYEVRDISDPANLGTGGESPAKATAGNLPPVIIAAAFILIVALCAYDTVHTDQAFYRAFARPRRVVLYTVRILVTLVMSTTIAAICYLFVNI